MTQEATGDEFEADLQPATTQTTRRGRGRAAGGGRRVTQVTKREFIEPEGDEESVEQLPGLFARQDIEEHSITRVRVIRKDPDEGMLGYLDDPNDSEDVIAQRWGGGTFRCEGLNNIGRIVKVCTVKLAADPIFVSDVARAKWERQHGVKATVQNGNASDIGVKEMFALMQQMDDKRRGDEETRRQREAEERRAHEERMRRLELDAEDRRRKDELDREERRRRDEAEREERRRKDINEADQRQRTHLDTMMALMRQSSEQAIQAVTKQAGGGIMDAVKMVVAIKSAFEGDGGGAAEGENDPLTLLIKHGHEWLGGLGNAVTGAIREVKGGGTAPAQPQLPPNVAVHPQQNDGSIILPPASPVTDKLRNLANELASRGQNPEVIIAQVLENANSVLKGHPAPAPAKPATQKAPEPPVTSANVQAAADHGAPAPAPAPAAAAPPPAPAANGAAVQRSKIASEKTARGSTRISFS